MSEVGARVSELLARLEQELDGQGSPFSSAAAPPVDPRRLDDAETRVGMPFPDELRAWWLWHDGAQAQPGRSSAHVIGVGGFEPYSLDKALAQWVNWSQESIFRDHSVSEWKWLDSWVPFAGLDQATRLNAKLELSSPDRLVMGIVEMPWEGEFGETVDVTFPELIEGWIEYLRAGHVRWDHDGDCWEYHLPPIPGYDRRLYVG